MEILLAILANLRAVWIGAAILLGCAAGAGLLAWSVDDWEGTSKWRAVSLRTTLAAFFFSLLACIPTINDLWEVRIALVKYELASPENVQKGTAEIQRIAAALECKYLDNCGEKK